ncbi:MAG: hypothetical protein A3I77_06795 [Gammaproteobacteria bacterium RIFCSPLOWO2_02_FULL_42_14]|nr:MAG: hypothetical protein A3B71_02630 [Gammaproteobacteria bacterium RIFCSPHIGHO2_02_FULL_42_43]OGT28004.1 MAG: hypothetical protein A2624_03945 [Gammaproteobacteria bacterium RIFCSPHIGHO2_01_FULL_42_8]OGT51968.1 MAG: hypothetical protein A3E54_04135 [Gammaproteobacteria bacterium RIFCSPHIGHO2_12_FULL_41_25]OGT61073.1 MAG: hypothetical protein A3I77_06795 [Gammaproteobacteria bacterium RIFCSPLOWO2_02_FULL_42_14]OGT87001.1 MAG: hypothetical protein A3G86_00515 [Gammaproteobacteria bacterium R
MKHFIFLMMMLAGITSSYSAVAAEENSAQQRIGHITIYNNTASPMTLTGYVTMNICRSTFSPQDCIVVSGDSTVPAHQHETLTITTPHNYFLKSDTIGSVQFQTTGDDNYMEGSLGNFAVSVLNDSQYTGVVMTQQGTYSWSSCSMMFTPPVAIFPVSAIAFPHTEQQIDSYALMVIDNMPMQTVAAAQKNMKANTQMRRIAFVK